LEGPVVSFVWILKWTVGVMVREFTLWAVQLSSFNVSRDAV